MLGRFEAWRALAQREPFSLGLEYPLNPPRQRKSVASAILAGEPASFGATDQSLRAPDRAIAQHRMIRIAHRVTVANPDSGRSRPCDCECRTPIEIAIGRAGWQRPAHPRNIAADGSLAVAPIVQHTVNVPGGRLKACQTGWPIEHFRGLRTFQRLSRPAFRSDGDQRPKQDARQRSTDDTARNRTMWVRHSYPPTARLLGCRRSTIARAIHHEKRFVGSKFWLMM